MLAVVNFGALDISWCLEGLFWSLRKAFYGSELTFRESLKTTWCLGRLCKPRPYGLVVCGVLQRHYMRCYIGLATSTPTTKVISPSSSSLPHHHRSYHHRCLISPDALAYSPSAPEGPVARIAHRLACRQSPLSALYLELLEGPRAQTREHLRQPFYHPKSPSPASCSGPSNAQKKKQESRPEDLK